MGTSNTLVLLNGRRMANYAFDGAAVDINSIPLSAVERVEILRDGASAIYGTDAIGGVINFILSKSFKGVEITGYATDVDKGGGNTKKATLTAGFGDLHEQGFNVLASFDWEKQDPLKASQRSFAKTAVRPDIGIVQTSGNTYPANFSFQATDGNSYRANAAAFNGCDPKNGTLHVSASTGQPTPTSNTCRYDFTSVLDIFPPSERKSAVVRGSLAIDANTELFAEATYVNSLITYASSETPVNDFRGNGPFTYPAGGPFYPTTVTLGDGTVVTPTGQITSIAWRLKDGGRRTDKADSTATRIVAGLKGLSAGWDYEAAVSRAESKVADKYVDGWVRESLLNAAIATGNINVFGGPQNATGQALINSAKILEVVRDSKGTTTSVDAKASKDFAELAGGTAAFAFGGEYRKEELSDDPKGVLRSGDILGGGGDLPPVKGSRNVSAIFTEFSLPFAKGWEAQIAARYDNYSDFGSTVNPKLGLRWIPTKELLVRASANTGFRAPSLPEIYLPAFTTNTANSYSDPLRCPDGVAIGPFVNEGLECDAQIQSRRGGNRALQPEKSKQWALGAVFEPIKDISVSLDYWGIRRRNSIGVIGETRIFDQFGTQDPLNAQGGWVRTERVAGGGCRLDAPGNPTPVGTPCPIDYYYQPTQNLGEFRISGVDIGGDARLSSGIGKFRFGFEGTLLTEYKFQYAKNSVYVDNLGKTTSENNAIPRWKHTATVTWSYDVWSATLIQNFVQGYEDENNPRTATTKRRVESSDTYDLQGTWSGFKGFTLAAGIRNLFDKDPPASNNGQNFQIGYDARNASPLGRIYYLKATYRFM
jgi:iron complex outermembrane receptor protein